MPTSAYVIGILVVVLTALFAVAYNFVPLYWAYQTTDAYRRAEAIRREVARLRAVLHAAETPPAPVPAQSVRDAAFRDCLRGVSISALKSYPGVGDNTVQRLLIAGYLTLLDADGRLTQPTFHVPGIGPSRVGEVVAAARAELRRQRKEFDGGANPFARRAETEIRRLTAQYDATIAERREGQARAQSALVKLEPQRTAAVKVTFWAYLRHRRAAPDQPWPCDPALQVPLPVPQVLPPAHVQPVAASVAVPEVPPRFPLNVEAVATILFAVARADGRLAAAERAAVRRGLVKFFEHDPVLVRHIDPAMDRLAAAPLDTDAALGVATTLPRRDRELLRACAEDISGAMGTRHPARDQMLSRVTQALTVPGEEPVPPPPDPTDLRSNDLLDGLFAGPAPASPVVQPVVARTAGGGLRDNFLLDDVFGR